ncbi:hypothetical protein SNE40_015152 [Patella caerulea]|uniref:Uncharacterized protein n=1 Tax=Patella caerulea TaxID=87958 RepID=A0AAN8PRN0_PATCE
MVTRTVFVIFLLTVNLVYSFGEPIISITTECSSLGGYCADQRLIRCPNIHHKICGDDPMAVCCVTGTIGR